MSSTKGQLAILSNNPKSFQNTCFSELPFRPVGHFIRTLAPSGGFARNRFQCQHYSRVRPLADWGSAPLLVILPRPVLAHT